MLNRLVGAHVSLLEVCTYLKLHVSWNLIASKQGIRSGKKPKNVHHSVWIAIYDVLTTNQRNIASHPHVQFLIYCYVHVVMEDEMARAVRTHGDIN
jgi:hypothetical protein